MKLLDVELSEVRSALALMSEIVCPPYQTVRVLRLYNLPSASAKCFFFFCFFINYLKQVLFMKKIPLNKRFWKEHSRCCLVLIVF